MTTELHGRLQIRPARTPQECLATAQLACQTLHEECRGEPWAQHPAPDSAIELALAASLTVAAWRGEQPVATASIHRRDPARARADRTDYGLPCERVATIRPGAFGSAELVHGSYAACLRPWRGLGLLDRILDALCAATRDCAVLTVAATWLRTPGEAAGLWARLAQSNPQAGRRVLARDPHTSVAGHCPVDGPIPWLIAYYRRVGFELAGEPIFMKAYGMYALPMVLPPRC